MIEKHVRELKKKAEARDAICSSSDEGYEMLMRLYHTRYTEQIETAVAATIPRAVGMSSIERQAACAC